MRFLTDRERGTVAKMLAQMQRPVEWLLVGREDDPRSVLSRQLAEEVHALMPEQIRLSMLWTSGQETDQHSPLARGPAWALLNHRRRPSGFRFLGLPTGYQFGVLLNAMLDVSRQRLLVEPQTYFWCRSVRRRMNLCLMVTPTCPHSPRMATLVQRLAFANASKLTATAVDATAFADWAEACHVQEVPWLKVAYAGSDAPALAVTGTVGERELVSRLKRWQEETEEAGLVLTEQGHSCG